MKKNKLEREDWKDYELQILKLYRELHPKKFVLDNQMLVGRHSLKKRQVDVVIYNNSLTLKVHSIVECKNLSRKVSLTYIDSLQGKMEDLGVTRASIVTTKGFSDGVKNYAEKKNIELKKIDYEYLKDYYYMSPIDVPDIFIKATRYSIPYCEACNISAMYEIGEVYGMAEYEPLYCPKCKIQLEEVRSDANHRVIKLFLGKRPSKQEINKVKAKHIFITRDEWQSWIFLQGIVIDRDGKNSCYLCKNEFCEHPPTHSKIVYKNKNVCSECMMSDRTLLIDYKLM